MQITTGTFGATTLESNSLVANLLKYPSINTTLVDLWPQYTLSSFVERTERYATEVEYADKRVQWAAKNRTRRASRILTASAPASAATVSGPSILWTINFDPQEDHVYPNDIINLFDVNVMIVSKLGNTATVRIHNYDSTVTVTMANLTGVQCGVIGTAYPEGSTGGQSVHGFPDWYDNYMSIQRRTFDITGSAYTDVTWIENNGQKLWYFTAMQDFLDNWAYEKEIKRWVGTRTVTAAGAPTQFDQNGKPIYDGDGLLAQGDSGLMDSYANGVITRSQIDSFVQSLKKNGGVMEGGEIMVWGGLAAQQVFSNAMQNAYLPNGNVVWNPTAGANISLGGHFTTYFTMGVKLTFALCPFFDDETVFGSDIITSAALGGAFNRRSFDMIFVNTSLMGKGSNLELAVKSAGGINRANVVKYISGMFDPHNPSSMYAMTSDDKFSVEVLCESALILKNGKAFGRLFHA
jgi:hypothetical protein